MKRFFSALLAVAMIICGTTSAFASTVKNQVIYSPMYDQICEVDNGLTPNGNTLDVYAATIGYSNATSCSVTAVLQRKSGSTWSDYKTWKATSATYYVEIDTSYTVPTGYSYRLLTTHSVTVGSTTEYEYMTSNTVTV